MCALFFYAYWHLNEGFSLSKIQGEKTFSARWEVEEPPLEEIRKLLDQHFYYLDRGSQCYVFESEDKQLVLKFFRHSRYRLPKLTQLFTFPAFLHEILQKKREAKEQKLDSLYQSCKIAFEELHEESGILFLHLNPTKHLCKQVILHDKLKRVHRLNIDDYAFVIQKYGEQVYPYLTRLLERAKKKEAKEALESLVAILSSRLEKGITDHDAVIPKNAGFLRNQAFFLDIGEFEKKSCENPYLEIQKATDGLRRWLNEQDPELVSYLDRAIGLETNLL
jgi:hypothetical protein